MERARRKRSSVPTAFGGNLQIIKRTSGLNLESSSNSCSRNTDKQDAGMPVVRPTSAKQINGVPVKMLLAEEMSRGVEVKRRSPGIIARLMGLDGLPSPRTVQKQRKAWSENHDRHNASIGGQMSGQHYEVQLNQKNSFGHQEFKDVYEDLEASYAPNCNYESKCVANSRLTKSELACMQRRFLDTKCLSPAERIHVSRGLNETFGTVESNIDLELKCFQRHDPVPMNCLQDLRNFSTSSCGNIVLLKSENSTKFVRDPTEWEVDRERKHLHKASYHRQRMDAPSIHSHNYYGAEFSTKFSKIQSEKSIEDEFPTRIIVLKPNLVGSPSAINCVLEANSSYCFQPECRKQKESPRLTTEENELLRKSKEARQIANKITRKMRERFVRRPMNSLPSESKGYAGDESSCCLSGSDSTSDSEVDTTTSQHSFHWNNWHKSAFSRSTKSSFNREAKRRLSERWKRSRRSYDKRVVGSVSTLGEMLAIPCSEMRFRDLDDTLDLQAARDGRIIDNERSNWNKPPSFRSKHDSIYGSNRNLNRSESVPRSSLGNGNKRNFRYVAPSSDACLVSEEVRSQGRGTVVEGDFSGNYSHSFNQLELSPSKPLSASHRSSTISERFSDVHSISKRTTGDPVERELLGKQVSQGHADSYICTSSVADAVAIDRYESKPICSESSVGFPQKASGYDIGDGDSSTNEIKKTLSQDPSTEILEEGNAPLPCHKSEPTSSEIQKEADHPSPVSVLDDCFIEDGSSNLQCFERVSADLHDLRRQLQLLKMESASEIVMPSSGDEDSRQESFIPSEQKEVAESEKEEGGEKHPKTWELSYLDDVIAESGLEEIIPDLFMTTWHSPRSPLGPCIYNRLEKTYCHETKVPGSERKLLFDRINFAMLEISRGITDHCPCPFLKPGMNIARLKWPNHRLRDELHKLLATQEMNANEVLSEKVVDQETQWLESLVGNDGFIVEELEKVLIDDLLIEVVTT